jgi:hypothetical protein
LGWFSAGWGRFESVARAFYGGGTAYDFLEIDETIYGKGAIDMARLDDLLSLLWDDYVRLNPHAQRVHDLLTARGETVHNDHIAFRTWDDPRVNIDVVAAPFVGMGYEAKESYEFPAKKLFARHYEHKEEDRPRVFISQLKAEAFSEGLRAKVRELVDQLPEGTAGRWDFPVVGRPWTLSYAEYERLAEESEYAGWLAAMGFRANHFTVDVNRLETFGSLQELNTFLKEKGFALNTAGGEIKGSPADYLEQSSTLAEEVAVEFKDGVHRVPGCYYEFARRYPLPSGKLFSGFVAKSADKIFQSTDRR